MKKRLLAYLLTLICLHTVKGQTRQTKVIVQPDLASIQTTYNFRFLHAESAFLLHVKKENG